MITGNRQFVFKKELLAYDNDGWLGFNKNHDFFSSLPDDDVLHICPIFMPGTAYNLNFAMKMEAS